MSEFANFIIILQNLEPFSQEREQVNAVPSTNHTMKNVWYYWLNFWQLALAAEDLIIIHRFMLFLNILKILRGT